MLTWLRQRFNEAQNRTALIWQDELVTYGWLLKEMDRAAADVCAAGIRPPDMASAGRHRTGQVPETPASS